MDLYEIIQLVHPSTIVVLLLTLIQITPLQINPWTTILKCIRHIMIGDMNERLERMEDALNTHVRDGIVNEMSRRRASILSYSDGLMFGINHTKESFDFMIHECDEYERYCIEKGIKNGVISLSISNIKAVYLKKMQDNSFLKEETGYEYFQKDNY